MRLGREVCGSRVDASPWRAAVSIDPAKRSPIQRLELSRRLSVHPNLAAVSRRFVERRMIRFSASPLPARHKETSCNEDGQVRSPARSNPHHGLFGGFLARLLLLHVAAAISGTLATHFTTHLSVVPHLLPLPLARLTLLGGVLLALLRGTATPLSAVLATATAVLSNSRSGTD